MDGFKKRLKSSIQLRLSIYLTMTILVIAVVAGFISFRSAFHEVTEFQDNQLRQVASLFNRHQVMSPSLSPRHGMGSLFNPEDETRIMVQFLVDGRSRWESVGNNPVFPIPTNLEKGFYTLKVPQGPTFRVFIKTIKHQQKIAVLQDLELRDDIAKHSARRTVMPILFLVPILLLVVAHLIRKMFQPMLLLSKEIEQRSEQELYAVDEKQVPVEIRPFASAINQLLSRVAQLLENQRRFIADAAHELRSPLTALSLQAERLAETEMSVSARSRLVSLRKGIERSRNLLDQLLTLAKVQSRIERSAQTVSVNDLYRKVLEDILPMAQAKNIDIGIEGDTSVELITNEIDLMIVIKNMIDNAVRYTSEGGRVDLSSRILKGEVVLNIKDTGPGISPEERTRVFDPFYRVLGNQQVGSGLGLSIAKTIVERLGGRIELDYSNREQTKGLCASIYLPSIKH
jgi:two-component system OmpR family sensor kinase